MRKINKKGLSPVVATILLIAIVIILAIIIFLWARSFVAEQAQKFDRAVELSCPDVNIEVGVFDENGQYVLDVINRGDVPVYGFVVKRLGEGEVSLVNENVEGGTITSGQSSSIALGGVSSGEDLLIIPKILGSTGAGNVAHICADNHGIRTTVP